MDLHQLLLKHVQHNTDTPSIANSKTTVDLIFMVWQRLNFCVSSVSKHNL